MSETSQDVERKGGVKLDLTINIPTIVLLFSAFGGMITFNNNQINTISSRQLVTEGDVKVLQTQIAAQTSAQAALRSETAGQLQQFRTEVRQDLRDLKDGVERINNNQRGR